MTELLFWHWLVLGAVLGVLEIIVPGVFMLWLAIAAAVTGLIAFVASSLPWQVQAVIFAALSVLSVWGWRLYQRKHPTETDQPTLNRRGEQYVGRRLTLEQPIVNGRGQARVGDSSWRVEGPDLPAGTAIVVTGVEGTVLKVERAA
jgi:inner membrane protein